MPYVTGSAYLTPWLVDDHVAGDRQRHAQCESHVPPMRAAADAADDEDTDSDERDAGDLSN